MSKLYLWALTALYRLLALGGGEHIRAQGRFTITSYDAVTHELVEQIEGPNVVCTLGKGVILNFLGGITSVAGIQYLAVGTGAGTPASSDVTLFSELARQAITQAYIVGSTVIIQIFFTSALANGTWTELGAFGNGATAAANSGTMFAHCALSYTKTSALETIVNYQLTLT